MPPKVRRLGDPQGQAPTNPGDDDRKAARTFDEAFLHMLVTVESTYKALPRSLQIRVERWVLKLSEPCTNNSFRRNRNLHAALLAEMVRTQEFVEPFDGLPPEARLARLPGHMVSRLDIPGS